MAPVELLEMAKLLETSYFGVLIMWAKEMHCFAEQIGGDYWDLFAFFDEIDYLPGAASSRGSSVATASCRISSSSTRSGLRRSRRPSGRRTDDADSR